MGQMTLQFSATLTSVTIPPIIQIEVWMRMLLKPNHWDYAFDHIKKICDLRMHTNEYMPWRKVAQKQVGVEQTRDHVVARS